MSYENYMEQYNKIGYSKDGITHIKNFVPETDRNVFIDYLSSIDDEGTFTQDMVPGEVKSLLMHYDKLVYQEVIEHYGKKYSIPFKPEPRQYAHLTKWGMLEGHSMAIHSDSETPSRQPAIVGGFWRYNITSLSYLTDEYLGGEIDFPEFDITIKPKAGDMLLFPSRYKHRILELKGGKRYTMPMFFQFDVNDNIELEIAKEGTNPSDVLFFE